MQFNESHYQKLKPFYHYWHSLKTTSSAQNIQQEDLKIMDSVFFDLHGVHCKISCQTCVIDLIQQIYWKYDKYEANKNNEGVEAPRERRPRIQHPTGS